MAEKNSVSTLYTILISGGATIIVGMSAFIVNGWNKAMDKKDISHEKEIAELKGYFKEQILELKKNMNESFDRIRDLENIQNVLKTEFDILTKRRDNEK